MEKSESNELVPGDARQAFRICMLKQLLGDKPKTIDGRLMVVLAKNGLARSSFETSLPEDVRAIMLDPSHRARMKDGNGPSIAFDAGNKVRGLVELRTLLLHNDQALREVALKELTKRAHSAGGSQLLSPRTLAQILSLQKQILSQHESESMGATLQAADLLDEDFFFRVSDLCQSVVLKDSEGLQKAVRGVLSPESRSIRFLKDLPAWNPRRQASDLLPVLNSVVTDADSINELLDRYYRLFGHLPLMGDFSLGGAARAWVAANGLNADSWDVVWSWEDQHRSPLATYHACQLFCHNPLWVRTEQRQVLLRRISGFVHASREDRRFVRRVQLANHYRMHLEMLDLWVDGDSVSACALWLAEFVCSRIDDLKIADLGKLDGIVNAIIASTDELWRISRPPVTASVTRCGMMLCENIWIPSLLGELSQSDLSLAFDVDEEFAKEIDPIMDEEAIYPIPSLRQRDFAFEHPSELLFSRVDDAISSDTKNERTERREEREKLRLDSEFECSLAALANAEQRYPGLIARELYCRAVRGRADESQLFKLMSEPEWRNTVLAHKDGLVAEYVFSALCEVAVQASENDWAHYLPHFLALVCEDAVGTKTVDNQLVRRLFEFVIVASVTLNSASAVQRLLAGGNRTQYRELTAEWEARISSQSEVPGWISAKFRGLLASIP